MVDAPVDYFELCYAKSKVSQSKSAAAHAGVVRALAEHVIATAIKKI
jgi:predicted FMN-binding regulatory protein PaiB